MRARWAVVAAAVIAVAGPATARAASWAPAKPLQPGGFTYVSTFSDGSGWVATSLGQFLRTTDAGLTWSDAVAPPGPGTPEIRMASPTTGWGLRLQQLYSTSDAATSWQPVASPKESPGDTLGGLGTGDGGRVVTLGVSPAPSGDPCVTTPPNSLLATSSNGGATWRRFELPYYAETWNVRWHSREVAAAVVFPLEINPGMVGGCDAVGLSADVWVTRNAGATWHVVLHESAGPALGVAWALGGRLIAASGPGEIRISDDMGAHWRLTADLVSVPGGLLTSVDAPTNSRVYALVNQGGIFRSDDGGETWTEEPSVYDAPATGMGEVAAFDAERAIAAGPGPISARRPDLPSPDAPWP